MDVLFCDIHLEGSREVTTACSLLKLKVENRNSRTEMLSSIFLVD
jgi:hypothetical protein